MKYFTVQAESYDQAVEKARSLYGSRVRVHSRKDTSKVGFFGTKRISTCEITCFLTDEEEPAQLPVPEQESKVEEPVKKEQPLPEIPRQKSKNTEKDQLALEFPTDEKVSEQLLAYCDELMQCNDFSPSFSKWMREQITQILVKALPDVPTQSDIQMAVADRIAMAIDIDHKYQNNLPPLIVLAGPPQSGKTSCAAKIAATCSHNDVGFLTLDTQDSSWVQARKLSEALGIECKRGVENLSAFSDKVLTVTDGFSLNVCESQMPDNLVQMYRTLTMAKAKFFAVIPATIKNSDLDAFFKAFEKIDFKGMIITKEDETTTVGNIISAVKEKKIPLVFVSDGKKIPKDFKKATSMDLLKKLRGFSIDFASYS